MLITEEIESSLVRDQTIQIVVIVSRIEDEYIFSFKGDGVAENGVLLCIGTEPVILRFGVNRGRGVDAVRFCPVPAGATDPWPLLAGVSTGPGSCPVAWDGSEFVFLGLSGHDRVASVWNKNSNGAVRYGYQLNCVVSHGGAEHSANHDPRIINRAN